MRRTALRVRSWCSRCSLGAAGRSAAQETGTPIFKAPYRAFNNQEFGASLSDPARAESYAIEGFYSYGSGPNDFSLRGGYVDQGPQGAVALGVDFRRRIIRASRELPARRRAHARASVRSSRRGVRRLLHPGRHLAGPSHRPRELEDQLRPLLPADHRAHLLLRRHAPDGGVDFALGLGVDIKFGGRLDVRVSGGIGDIDGVAIGLAYVH